MHVARFQRSAIRFLLPLDSVGYYCFLSGRKYDSDGNLYDWWDKTTSQRFADRTQCMVDQYSNYTYQNQHIRGKLTLGESCLLNFMKAADQD